MITRHSPHDLLQYIIAFRIQILKLISFQLFNLSAAAGCLSGATSLLLQWSLLYNYEPSLVLLHLWSTNTFSTKTVISVSLPFGVLHMQPIEHVHHVGVLHLQPTEPVHQV